MSTLPAARLWLEFPDPDQNVPANQVTQVFRADLTWLTSRWQCIYGQGCPGIYAQHPRAGCCALGAYFCEQADLDRVAGVVEQLGELWQHRPAAGQAWYRTDDDGEHTAAVDGACIFLNDATWHGGAGCALHLWALAHGRHPLEAKPDVCWQLPIRRWYDQIERPDGSGYLQVSIGEYDRTSWGPGGVDLDWYCTQDAAALTGRQPLFRALAPELTELIGPAAYQVVARACEQQLYTPDAAPTED